MDTTDMKGRETQTGISDVTTDLADSTDEDMDGGEGKIKNQTAGAGCKPAPAG